MARGNDAEAASVELRQTLDGEAPSADDLIKAHAATIDKDVQRASLIRADEEASAAIDLSTIKPRAEGDVVVAAAVRGGQIVYVAEEPDGRTYKGVFVPDGDAPRARGRSR